MEPWLHCKHELIKSNQIKIEAVTNWPTPTNLKQLQRFLGFANFYRRFMRNFNLVVATSDLSYLSFSPVLLDSCS